jgi:tetratricopeptide (TPR) repeat protein
MTVIVLGVFLMIVQFNFTPVRANIPVEVAPSFGLSGHIAKSVLGEKLIFGYGPENFSLAFDKYGASRLANSTLSNLRFFDGMNQIFTWVVHGGIIMIIALLLFFWALVESLIKSLRKVEDVSEYSGVVALLWTAVFALFLYPFNLTIMLMLYISMALFVLVVWGGKRRVMDIEEKPLVSLASSIGFIVGLIVVLAGSYFNAVRYVSDVSFAKALQENDNTEVVDGLVRAINWNNQDDRYYRTLSQATLGLLNQEINERVNPSDTQRAKANNWFNLGTVYQSLIGLVDGAAPLAEDAYIKAADLRPGDASYFGRIGSMYLAQSDLLRQLARSAGVNARSFNQQADDSLEKAEEYFKKAIDIANNYGFAIYNLGAVYDRKGELTEAITQLEKIIPYNANQPGLLFELGLLYYRVDRKTDALAALQRAVLLSPDYANARWYLSLVYEELGDLDSAIQQLEVVLKNNKENATVIQKLSQLKRGESSIPPETVLDQEPLD